MLLVRNDWGDFDMKHTTAICILLALLLTVSLFGCTAPGQEVSYPTVELQFPGLEWGMNPQELCAALKLSGGEYVEMMTNEGEIFHIAGVYLDVFGANAQIDFIFFDYNSDGEYCLYRAMLIYPEDADMQAVKAAVTEQYGEPAEQEGNAVNWESKALIQDYMSEEDLAMVELHGEVVQRLSRNPVSGIVWTENHPAKLAYDGEETNHVLSFHSDVAKYIREGGYAAHYAEE